MMKKKEIRCQHYCFTSLRQDVRMPSSPPTFAHVGADRRIRPLDRHSSLRMAGGYADLPLQYRGFETAISISGNGILLHGKRQFDETKPMESFNKSNGIVQRNQWNG